MSQKKRNPEIYLIVFWKHRTCKVSEKKFKNEFVLILGVLEIYLPFLLFSSLFFNTFSSIYPCIIFSFLFFNTFSSFYSFIIFSSLFFNTFSSTYSFIIFSSLFFNGFSSIYPCIIFSSLFNTFFSIYPFREFLIKLRCKNSHGMIKITDRTLNVVFSRFYVFFVHNNPKAEAQKSYAESA